MSQIIHLIMSILTLAGFHYALLHGDDGALRTAFIFIYIISFFGVCTIFLNKENVREIAKTKNSSHEWKALNPVCNLVGNIRWIYIVGLLAYTNHTIVSLVLVLGIVCLKAYWVRVKEAKEESGVV